MAKKMRNHMTNSSSTRGASSIGNGGGYMTIPENEELDTPHELCSTVLTTRSNNSKIISAVGKHAHRVLMEEEELPASKSNCFLVSILSAISALIIVGMGVAALLSLPPRNVANNNSDGKSQQQQHQQYTIFDELNRFIVEDYDTKPPFSDFLPGVAGLYGKPLWCYYINRGQTIASFGTFSKDYPILEYNSANKAYQNTPLLGFRTFLMVNRTEEVSLLIEPFSALNIDYPSIHEPSSRPPRKRFLYIGVNEIQIQEIDYQHRIETNISYFILPEESFGALVRRTTVRNLDISSKVTLSALDGLARMEPAGGGPLNHYLKNMGQTLQAWFNVFWADNPTNKTMPFYKMSSQPRDDAAVVVEASGHYCVSVLEDSKTLLPIVYDPSLIFGQDTTLIRPAGLYQTSIRDIVYNTNNRHSQYGMSKTSSCFAALTDCTILPGETITFTTLYGKTEEITDVPLVARKITQQGYIPFKLSRARDILKATSSLQIKTSHNLMDAFSEQAFLDNSLRGGVPMLLGDVDDKSSLRNADEDSRIKVFHVFSRVHGDLERDYNNFSLDSTFFSQGPGNFRDVLQNRRNDVVFNPRIGAFNIKMFLSYIQADGYNPLTVEASVFVINDKQQCDRLANLAAGTAVGNRAQRDALDEILCVGPFRPGQLFLLLEEQNVVLLIDRQRFIEEVMSVAVQYPMAVFSDGYWADHWTYYLDLVDSYLSIYPEGEESLMYGDSSGLLLSYFFSPATVKPRREKYVLSYTFDGKSRHVRQLNATVFPDQEKFALQMADVQKITGWYGSNANWQCDSQGLEFKSTPIAKLLLLAVLKYATRDVYGMGIEYEAGKPGWNDAMNGLPGMLGSGMPEALELKRLLLYINSVVLKYQRPVLIPEELGVLIDDIDLALSNLDKSDYKDADFLKAEVPDDLFRYWDTVATARESYREKVRLSFVGTTRELSWQQISAIMDRWVRQIDLGLNRATFIGAHYGNGFSVNVNPTYFAFDVTTWEVNGGHSFDGSTLVNPKSMRVRVLAPFLEGPTRMMKIVSNEQSRKIYNEVKVSDLRDEPLKMYKISSSLEGQSIDIGRMMAFSPGWLENQSVWLHMSYKYYLEILRSKLYAEFYEEISSGLPPFMNATVYGRSLVECSSFIASSAYPDPSVRGRGFLARFSGATAEFLSMWILMFLGPKPFFLDEKTNELSMQLVPALPLWLFEEDGTAQVPKLSFRLFNSIHVTYHNTARRDLFHKKPIKYLIKYKDGSTILIQDPVIPADIARKIRGQLLIDGIDVFF